MQQRKIELKNWNSGLILKRKTNDDDDHSTKNDIISKFRDEKYMHYDTPYTILSHSKWKPQPWTSTNGKCLKKMFCVLNIV